MSAMLTLCALAAGAFAAGWYFGEWLDGATLTLILFAGSFAAGWHLGKWLKESNGR